MFEVTRSITEIEDLFFDVVCQILRLDPENSHKRIRFPWGSKPDSFRGPGSVPDWQRDEDVCFIHATPYDDAYNRQRHIRYIYEGGEDMTSVDEHTDVHNILFINYGPNAYECARGIRNGLYRDDIRRLLRLNHFFIVTDTPAPRRVPELVNSIWYNRVDVSATFNQFVRLVGTMGTIERVGVTVVQESGRTGYFETDRNSEAPPRKE